MLPKSPWPLRRPAITRGSVATVAGWLTYWGIRLWLGATYGLKTYGGAVGLDALRINLATEHTAMGFVTGLESFWMLLALALMLLVRQRHWQVLLALLLTFGPILAGSFLVLDITRSLAFGFPVVLLALVVLQHYLARESLRQLALVVLVFAVLIPNYYFQLATFYSESIFEKAGRYVLLHT